MLLSSAVIICKIHIGELSSKISLRASTFLTSLKGHIRLVFMEMECLIRGLGGVNRDVCDTGASFSKFLNQQTVLMWLVAST